MHTYIYIYIHIHNTYYYHYIITNYNSKLPICYKYYKSHINIRTAPQHRRPPLHASRTGFTTVIHVRMTII